VIDIARSMLPRIANCARSCRYHGLLALAFVASMIPFSAAQGVQVDVSLNLFYNNTADPTSGGIWTLSAKTDEFGLNNLDVYVQGIVGDGSNVILRAPTGAVNGTQPAGFFKAVSTNPGYTNLAVLQIPTRDGMGEEGVFYGVGSIIDPEGAAPNFPGQPAGTTSIGPQMTTLTNVQRGVWGNGDELGDTEWDHAAVLLAGTFLPGSSPTFFSSATVKPSATVYLDTGSLTVAGATSNPAETVVTTIIRSDLEFRGDYNVDGVVDAADYLVWRNTTGTTVQPLSGADGNGDGMINVLDYIVWKNFFGMTAPTPGGLIAPATTVPEPSAALFATFAVVMSSAALRIRFKPKNGESRGQRRNFEKMYNPGETA
jgi:hypothetical protein